MNAGEAGAEVPVVMKRFLTLTAATGALVIVAFVALQVLRPALNVGPPSPTSALTVPPIASPSALVASDIGRILDAGRYAATVGVGGRRFDFQLAIPPNGWTAGHVSQGEVSISGPAASGTDYVGFFSVLRVYNDPCHPERGFAGSYLGPSNSSDLVNELRSLRGFTPGPSSSVTVGGYPTTHFSLTNQIDTAIAGCSDGALLPLFATSEAEKSAEPAELQHSPATNGGVDLDVWVVDRDLYPMLIIGEVGDDILVSGRPLLEAIISSITVQ